MLHLASICFVHPGEVSYLVLFVKIGPTCNLSVPPLMSISQVLGLQVCTISPSWDVFLMKRHDVLVSQEDLQNRQATKFFQLSHTHILLFTACSSSLSFLTHSKVQRTIILTVLALQVTPLCLCSWWKRRGEVGNPWRLWRRHKIQCRLSLGRRYILIVI